LQVGDTGPVESARRSNSRVLGSPFSGLSGHFMIKSSYHILLTISRLSLAIGPLKIPFFEVIMGEC
jgi:hypothetical protein